MSREAMKTAPRSRSHRIRACIKASALSLQRIRHLLKGFQMPKVHTERPSARPVVVQVSLPRTFGEELRAHAELQGRSMAAQIEHWSRIAMAIETISPGPALASVKALSLDDPSALRAAFSRFLLGPSLEVVATQMAAAQQPSYGMSPDKPGVFLRIDPDGSRTEGTMDAQGNFVPVPTALKERTTHHARQKPEPKTERKRAAAPSGRSGIDERVARRSAVPA